MTNCSLIIKTKLSNEELRNEEQLEFHKSIFINDEHIQKIKEIEDNKIPSITASRLGKLIKINSVSFCE